MTIFFDMDGTLADLYGVENWLDYLLKNDPFPYAAAKAMLNLQALARVLNRLHRNGIRIEIISWLSKNSNREYDEAVTEAKKRWLAAHLSSVTFDAINIVSYGYPKDAFRHSSNDILFDDEEQNRNFWNGIAYGTENIIEILKAL